MDRNATIADLQKLVDEVQRVATDLNDRLLKAEGEIVGLKSGITMVVGCLERIDVLDREAWNALIDRAATHMETPPKGKRDEPTKKLVTALIDTIREFKLETDPPEGGFRPIVIPGGKAD